jgi:hypothetical protein
MITENPTPESSPQKFEVVPPNPDSQEITKSLFNGMIIETTKLYPGSEEGSKIFYPPLSDPPKHSIDTSIFKKFIKTLEDHIECHVFFRTHATSIPSVNLTKKPSNNYKIQIDQNSDISEKEIKDKFYKLIETRKILSEFKIEELHQYIKVEEGSFPFISMRYISTPENYSLWKIFILLIHAYYRIPFHNPVGAPFKNDIYTPQVIASFHELVEEVKLNKNNSQNYFHVAFDILERKFPNLKGKVSLEQLKKLIKPSYRLKQFNKRALKPRNIWVTVTEGKS